MAMSDQSQQSAIDVHLRFFPLAFILYLCKPRAHVDGGQPILLPWGVRRIPVAPGRHELRAYVPYLFFRFMGDARVLVDVGPGQVVQATWSAPWLAFLPGSWKLGPAVAGNLAPVAGAAMPVAMVATPQSVGAATAVTQPAAWHPDPAGRHQLRYWDGQTWTVHVSDNGVTGTDPI